MAEQQPQQPSMQIKVTDEILKGVYANMAQAGFTQNGEEFLLDFFNVVPPVPIAVSRVIVSPSHFKRLVHAMEDNLKRYEEKYGTISLAVVPDQTIGFKTE